MIIISVMNFQGSCISVFRSSHPDVFCIKGVLCKGSLPEACNFIKKEALAQVFSYEFCEISKNTFLYRIPLVAASAFCVSENKRFIYENVFATNFCLELGIIFASS